MNVLDFQKMKNEGRKISMVTCYDYSSARAVAESSIDCILVGDSLATLMHGHPTTLSATTAMMALHTAAVARGAPSKFIVADLPFLSYRKGLKDAMDAVQELMTARAHAVKLEGVRGHAEIVRHIIDSGVPVMGHLGLTPQSINLLGGMKVQARNDAAIEILAAQALELESAGCFSLVARMRAIRGGAEGDRPPKNPHHRHWRRRKRQRAGSCLPGRARAQSRLQAEISAELRGHVRDDPVRAQCLQSRRQRGDLPLRERVLRNSAHEPANRP